MPVISFISPKGGAGKSTSAVVLATTLAAELKIALINTEREGGSSLWALKSVENGTMPENVNFVECFDEKKVFGVIQEAKKAADLVIVDTKGSSEHLNSMVIGATDLIVMPMNGDDVEAVKVISLMQQIHSIAEMTQRTPKLAVLIARTNAIAIPVEVRENIEEFVEHASVLKVRLISRKSYPYLVGNGGTLNDIPNKTESLAKAIDNAEALALEVVGLLKVKEDA